MGDRSAPPTRSIVVICTRNRSGELGKALADVRAIAPSLEVLVADSSEPEQKTAVRRVVADTTSCSLLDCTPGLARQRNQALDWIRDQRADTQIVHFIDDDTEPEPGYFAAVERAFAADPRLGGVGGVVVNQPFPRFQLAKYVFALYSPRPGVVLRSGRSTIGHYVGHEATRAEWLPGCAMSYRLDAIGPLTFDNRLEGYSLGEDLYFSYALGRTHRLTISEDARVVHHLSPVNRHSAERISRERIELLHRFVSENRDRGLRLSAFWWSVLGEAVLHFAHAIGARDPEALARARGVAVGGMHALRHPLPSGHEAP
jgi:glycosyltransferase involved in cell wall biosynthesis